MTKHVHCGSFFAGNENTEHKNWTLVVGDDGVIAYAGPTTAAPLPGPNATVVDYSGLFVMPGLLDVHTHLAYGNAKTEEDIDLYQPLEFRAIAGCSSRKRWWRPATPRSARPAMPARSASRSATPFAPACSRVRASPPPAAT